MNKSVFDGQGVVTVQRTFTESELALIQDALEISKSFKVYGDGREEHQAQIDSILQKL